MNIMKKPGVINYFFLSLVLFSGTIILYALFGIIRTEGFNPSDDGVILAQSYRLIQGLVPHLDFISIRPVGSAVLHSLHFISPLPLEVSARWLTLFQYLSYSLLWVWLMVRFTRIRKYRGLIFYFLLGVWAFLLNQNFYNLFPWTTIDALFWIVIALSFYLPDPKGIFQKRAWFKVALITFFASMAALSRQTFALPALIIVLSLAYHGIRRKKWMQLIAGFIIGAIPVILYFSVLVMNAAMPLFLEQMTGRTELIDTGIREFFVQFWDSPVVWFHILVVFLLLLYRLTEGSGSGTVFRIALIPMGRYAFAAIFTLMAFSAFLFPESLFGQSFMQFWMLVLLWVFEEVTRQIKPQQRRWFLWVVIISWTSAISLGDNAPVFALGLINVTALGYILFQFAERGFSFRRLANFQIISTALLLVLIFLSIRSQRKINYRDVSAGDQEYVMGELFPEFGKIKTNENCYSYIEEIDNLYQELGFPYGRFVVLPNAAIIYPILGSPNPLPVDWMQGPEFIGSEKFLNEGISSAVSGKEIFFLIDKYNSKRFADSLLPAKYPEDFYPYMEGIIDLTEEYPLESRWFNIRVSK